MFNTPITFQSEEKTYSANVTQINPPPDKQWHFFITDEDLSYRFGNFHIIVWNEKELIYTFGFPTI